MGCDWWAPFVQGCAVLRDGACNGSFTRERDGESGRSQVAAAVRLNGVIDLKMNLSIIAGRVSEAGVLLARLSPRPAIRPSTGPGLMEIRPFALARVADLSSRAFYFLRFLINARRVAVSLSGRDTVKCVNCNVLKNFSSLWSCTRLRLF
jgi:hypothetical protein